MLMRCIIHMMRNLSLAFFLLGSSLLTACATDSASSGSTPGDDVLAGESSADGDKADANALQDTFGIYTATKIGAFECNGVGSCTHVALALAGKASTTCADATKGATCSVRTLDFSKLALSGSALANAQAKLQASASTPEIGAQLLVRGKYVHSTNPSQPNVPDWVTFQVTELWVATVEGAVTEGTYVMVRDNALRCITAPCPTVNEARLNSSRNLNMNGLDYPTEMTSTQTSKLEAAQAKADGLIVAGDRTNGKVSGQVTTLRSINQAFVFVK
jgi:hypothetical protein